jgi:hypothetical protein
LPQISLLRRQLSVRFPEPGKPEEIVAVTYSTPAIPPRTVIMDKDLYRAATSEEIAAAPRYEQIPVSAEASELELKTVLQDIARHANNPPEVINV